MAEDSHSAIHPYLLDFSALYQRAEDLSHAYLSGNLVFFLGSGASRAYASELPTWHDLLDSLLRRMTFRDAAARGEIGALIAEGRYTLAAEAMRAYVVAPATDPHRAVDAAVSDLLAQRLQRAGQRDLSLHTAILDYRAPILTTNFDTIVEDLIAAYGLQPYPCYTYRDERDASELLNPANPRKRYVFKLHGSVHNAQDLILDEQDYADFYFHARWPASLQLLRHVLASKMVVFIGFSLSDPELLLILRQATRYASSYQHIAFLHAPEVRPIELQTLRGMYKVDPILYQAHAELPLIVMEMRTFAPREDLPLHLQSERGALEAMLARVRERYEISEDSSSILFGSYVKYGRLAEPKNDIDLLFLTPYESFQPEPEDAYEGREIDITALARAEYEDLLRNGDPFASGVLVTGCALEDPNDYFGILARGFRARHDYQRVVDNIRWRYELRWIRLCSFEGADPADKAYLQACDQWATTLLQGYVLREDPPLGSLLPLSLLGNARYTIERFRALSEHVDVEYLLALMRAAKGIQPPADDYSVLAMAARFLNLLAPRYGRDGALAYLLPGTLLQRAPAAQAAEVYLALAGELAELYDAADDMVDFYTELEEEAGLHDQLLALQEACRARGYPHLVTLFDVLFFLRVQREIEAEEGEPKEEEAEEQPAGAAEEQPGGAARVASAVAAALEAWRADVAAMRARLSEEARALFDELRDAPCLEEEELAALLEEVRSLDDWLDDDDYDDYDDEEDWEV